ncbi:MAG TPA: preprotein translocase subunit SecG [Bacteroidales bacterium]|nr:preprotein translocase subunit SecG [Bacteroidales bacterium]
MYLLFSVVILIICVLLILIVLVQNSKGGGLASNFAGSNQHMGVRKTADFLEKATWSLAAGLLFLSILASISIPRQRTEENSVIQNQIENAVDPNAIPSFPTTVPQQSTNNNNGDNNGNNNGTTNPPADGDNNQQ